MAFLIATIPEGEDLGDTRQVRLHYKVLEAASRTQAVAIANAGVPPSIGDLRRTGMTVEAEDNSIDIYMVEATYSKKKEKKEGTRGEFSFEIGGGVQRITQSLKTVNKYAPDGLQAPDHKGAIGVTKDGVEGCEINLPTFSFSETHYYAADTVTNDWVDNLEKLAWTTNDSSWRHHEAGEILFTGCRGSFMEKEGEGVWQVAFNLIKQRNKENQTIGDINGIDKKGWEYLWVLYEETEDTDAKRLAKRPVAVYIEQVYEEGDFSTLPLEDPLN